MSASKSRLLSGLVLGLFVVSAGCAKKASTVTGRVTYEGEDVQAGWITFSPEDGQGRTVGAPIRQGRYKAIDVPTGKKRVQVISGDPNSGSSRDSGEVPDKVTPDQIAKQRDDLIPPDAIGNNGLMEVSKKVETHDVELQRPKRDTPLLPVGRPGFGPPGKGAPPGFPGKGSQPGFPK
jgi:hypothetical protein